MMMKQYGVLACLGLMVGAVLLVHGCEKKGDGKVAKQKPQSPEPFFSVKMEEDMYGLEKTLGPPEVDLAASTLVFDYALAPAGSAWIQSFGAGVGQVHVSWSSESGSDGPNRDQYWAVEFEGSPHALSVPLSELERSRRHSPVPFVHLVGLSRAEAAAKIGVKSDDLAGDVVRFRLDPRGFADVHIKPDDRVAAVELIWKAQAGDDGRPRHWPTHLSGNAEAERAGRATE